MTDRQNLDTALVERLSDAEHQSWASWMTYLFSVCDLPYVAQPSGQQEGVVLPQWAVDGWKAQAATPYANLSDTDQEGDRREVRKILPVIESYVQERIRLLLGEEVGKKFDILLAGPLKEVVDQGIAFKEEHGLEDVDSAYSWFRIMQPRNDMLITTPTLADRPGPEQRQAMIELAALAIACVQAIDTAEKEKADVPIPG